MIALFSKPTVFLTVNAFITQYCIIELTNVYFNLVVNQDSTLKLNEIFDQETKITWRHNKHHFSERQGIQKLMRFIYLFFRFFFVTFIFYFGPNFYFIVNQFRVQVANYNAYTKDD